MEQNMDNMELNEMREQISLLRDKLRQQEIVSEAAIMAAVKKGVKTLNRRGVAVIIVGLFALPFCCAIFSLIGMSVSFVIFTAIVLIISVLATAYAHFGLGFINVARTNLVQVGLQTARLRKIYKSWLCIAIPLILIWLYFSFRELAGLYGYDKESLTAMITAGAIGGIIGGAIGFWIDFRTIHEADEVLEHINEFQQLKE
ncbi:MAG: hypothetical protein E7131_06625 [Rikenellaceae bacterium]|nr:hypothetical protein [Rikenellaceae bacterium]